MEPSARDVQLLPAALQPVAFNVEGQPPAASAATEESNRFGGEIRRRVIFLSVFIAVYVVVNALVQYAFDAAAIENALEQIRAVTSFKGGPTLAVLLMRSVPSVTSSIALGLLVPLCGYIGAIRNSQGLMACFCGWNACYCCFGTLSLGTMAIFLLMLSTATPGINHYLELCDPVKCAMMPASITEPERTQRVVDCLAAGTWPDYQKQFAGPSYPQVCPKVMLKCDDSPPPLEPDLFAPKPDWFENSAIQINSRGEMNQPRNWDELQHGGLLLHDDSGSGLRRLVARYFPRSQKVFSHDGMLSLPMWDDSIVKKGLRLGPMPADPLTTCKPEEKGMKLIHEARLLLPELVPKLILFISVKLLLLIPVILLGCLGFYWGFDLFNRLGQGYGRLDGIVSPQQPPLVLLQQPLAPNVTVGTAVHMQAPVLAVPAAATSPTNAE